MWSDRGALMVVLTVLPSFHDGRHDDEASHFKRFKTCLFMYFWAALTVLLYYVRMRQLMSFRRFLFLPELILLCVWMTLIVLIPQVRLEGLDWIGCASQTSH